MAQEYIDVSHQEAHEKLTARLFWKEVGSNGYEDAGNVKEYADATTRSLVTRARAADGARHVNDEQPDLCHESYSFVLDERFPEQERLIKLATRESDESVTYSEGATASIESATKGKWFTIGAYNIANVTASASQSGELVEDTDYELDRSNGRIKFLTSANLSDGETVTLTFDRPAIQFEKYTTQQQSLFYVDVIIEEHNAFDSMFLRRSAARGYLNVIEFPTQSGEFGTYRVKFTPSAAMVWTKRPKASTMATAPERGLAGASSSSSSSSSASQSSSSSSSADTA